MKAIFGKKLTVGLILLAVIGTTTAVVALNNPTTPSQRVTTVHSASPQITPTTTEESVDVPDTTSVTPDTNSQVNVVPKTVTQAVFSQNPFNYGSSAWYVYSRRAQVGMTMPLAVGTNEQYCIDLLGNEDYPALAAPTQYSFGCSNQAPKRHLVFVEKLNDDGSFWISEMGSMGQKTMTDTTPASGMGVVDYRLIPAANVADFSYIP